MNLILLIKNGLINKSIEIINSNNTDLNITDDDLNTPLHIALEKCYFNLAKLLIIKNANIYCKNKKGKTPIDITFEKSNFDLISFMNL